MGLTAGGREEKDPGENGADVLSLPLGALHPPVGDLGGGEEVEERVILRHDASVTHREPRTPLPYVANQPRSLGANLKQARISPLRKGQNP